MRNSVDAEDVPILSDNFILFIGVAIIGDDFTLASENTGIS